MNLFVPFVIICCVTAGVGVLALLSFWYDRRTPALLPPQPSVRPPAPDIGSALSAMSFGAIMIALLLGLGISTSFMKEAQNWYFLRSATAITSGQAVTVRHSESIRRGGSYFITYQFEIVDQDEKRVSFTNEELIYNSRFRTLSRGQPVRIRYNPRDPQISTLVGNDAGNERLLHVSGFAGLLLFVIVFMIGFPLIGGMIAFVGVYRLRTERQALEREGFMLITEPDLQHGLSYVLLEQGPIARYVVQRDDRLYLSFGFIQDRAERAHAWKVFKKFQAARRLSDAERKDVNQLQSQLFLSNRRMPSDE